MARSLDVFVVGLTGNDGGLMREICNECFVVPSQHTTLIQEVHTILGHELCFNIEKRIFFND